MTKRRTYRRPGEPLVVPKLPLPKRICSSRQYVRWTKLARDWLMRYHGFTAESFIRIGDTEPTLNWIPFYPRHWQSIWRYGALPRWSGYVDKPPRNAIVYWPDGVDICSESFDPRDPIFMLSEIQHWMDFRYDDELEGLCGCCGGQGHFRLAALPDSLSGAAPAGSGSHAFGVAEEVRGPSSGS